MYIYCIHLFMPLFIIPSQSVFGKSFAKPLAKAFRKTSSISIKTTQHFNDKNMPQSTPLDVNTGKVNTLPHSSTSPGHKVKEKG